MSRNSVFSSKRNKRKLHPFQIEALLNLDANDDSASEIDESSMECHYGDIEPLLEDSQDIVEDSIQDNQVYLASETRLRHVWMSGGQQKTDWKIEEEVEESPDTSCSNSPIIKEEISENYYSSPSLSPLEQEPSEVSYNEGKEIINCWNNLLVAYKTKLERQEHHNCARNDHDDKLPKYKLSVSKSAIHKMDEQQQPLLDLSEPKKPFSEENFQKIQKKQVDTPKHVGTSKRAALMQKLKADFRQPVAVIKRTEHKQYAERITDPRHTANRVKTLVKEMHEAAKTDRLSNRLGEPAVHKLQLLEDVKLMLHRAEITFLVDNGMFNAMAHWLCPMADLSLPNAEIRCEFLKILLTVKIDKHVICYSGIGDAIPMIYNHSEETEHNKRMCLVVLKQWIKQFGSEIESEILNLPQDEHILREINLLEENEEELRKFAPLPKKTIKIENPRADEERARVPQPSRNTYIYRPESTTSTQFEQETRLKTNERILRIRRFVRDQRNISKMDRPVVLLRNLYHPINM